MFLGGDVRLIRITGEKWDISNKSPVFGDDPFSKTLLFLDNIAEQTPAVLFGIKTALFKLFFDDRGYERIGVDLSMRMMQCDAYRLAFIFKDKDVFDEISCAKLIESMSPHLYKLVD